MRATGIRFNKKNGGGKPTERYLDDIVEIIIGEADRKGFRTEGTRLTGSAIKIGLRMSSFRIDTEMRGYNARIGRHVASPKGYKRTDVPTWEQRVEFNNLINSVFDRFGLVANIKSGCFTVRDKVKGANDEYDWENQTPSWMGYHGATLFGSGEECYRIVTESEAREDLDSDRLEAEHKAKTAEERRVKGREYRARMKLFRAAKKVTVGGFYMYGKNKGRWMTMTHKAFEKLCAKLNPSERRNVREVSISNTIALMGF